MSAILAMALAASAPFAAGTETTRISGASAEYDREAGIAVFEGGVRVEHAGEYTMNADSLYAVMSASNELGRVVAEGCVTITNGTRVGTCARALYRRAAREIEMFGDGSGVRARLVDTGENPGELEGDHIRFWLDTEQVEVENSRIKTGNKEVMKLL